MIAHITDRDYLLETISTQLIIPYSNVCVHASTMDRRKEMVEEIRSQTEGKVLVCSYTVRSGKTFLEFSNGSKVFTKVSRGYTIQLLLLDILIPADELRKIQDEILPCISTTNGKCYTYI